MGAVLTVVARIDRSAPGSEDPDWIANVEQPAELAGLFAFAPSFNEARESVAEVVWQAVGSQKDLGVDQSEIDAVRVFAVTRKTFSVDELAGMAGNGGTG